MSAIWKDPQADDADYDFGLDLRALAWMLATVLGVAGPIVFLCLAN